MINMSDLELARVIHEERIRDVQTPKPEWMYAAALQARLSSRPSASRRLRYVVAEVLRRVAAGLEPTGSAWQPPSSRQPTPTR